MIVFPKEYYHWNSFIFYLHGYVILHVVLQMVWVVDTRQTVVVVIIGDELSFLGKVGSLLCKHIAERIISETCNAACRMVHLCATVAHVVSRGRYIALRVGDTNKALYAVILKRGGNITVRSAVLDGEHCTEWFSIITYENTLF